MTRIAAIALLALSGSAYAADKYDQQAAYNGAVLKHAACTEAAAVKLAKKEGEPYELAYEALRACKAEEAELAKLISRDDLQLVLGNVLRLRRRTIIEERAGPQPNKFYCAACGLDQRWDDRLKVWRRPGAR